jgi:hypothetical protein
VDAQLAGDGADTPLLDVVIAQDLRLEIRWDGHGALLVSGRGSRPAGGEAGTRCGRRADSDIHTSGSARTRGRDLGIALQRHAMTPLHPNCTAARF